MSDQPVEPSFGTIAFTGGFFVSPLIRFAMICHDVPITVSPAVEAEISFV